MITTPALEDATMPRSIRTPLARGFASLAVATALGACGHHAAPELAAAPAPPPKHTTAWEDSVVLAKMTADRRAADQQKAAAERALASEREALTRMTFFSFDQAALADSDRAVLDAKIPVLQGNPSLKIMISGNCDDRGSEEYNLALGQQRAAAAKRYLVSHGVDAARIQIISYGLERPLVREDNDSAWAVNRNDQFLVIAGELKERARTE
jgi:peptidoglycan-associated lipoprotein